MTQPKLFLPLLCLTFSVITLSTPHCPFSDMEIPERTVPTADIKFTYGNNNPQNELIVDRTSNKSAFEQYLDAIEEGDISSSSTLETPYRDVTLLDTDLKRRHLYFYNPHKIEVNWQYSCDLERQLMNSDLLVAAAYAQMRRASNDRMLIDSGKHGVWKCDASKCWKFDECVSDLIQSH